MKSGLQRVVRWHASSERRCQGAGRLFPGLCCEYCAPCWPGAGVRAGWMCATVHLCRGEAQTFSVLFLSLYGRALALTHRYTKKLWGEAGAPGGTVRRAAVRKRGSGSASLR